MKVRLLGVFRGLSGKGGFLLRLKEPTPVREVVQRLVEPLSSEFKRVLIDSEFEDPRPNALILLNGREVSVLRGLETEVCDGDEVTIIPVSHGG